MLIRKSILGCLIALCSFAMTGCLEMTGQRITMFNDAANDRLHFMLYYDGFYYRNGNNDQRKSVDEEKVDADAIKELETFVKGKEIMVIDWPFHVKPEEMRAKLTNDEEPKDVPPAVRKFGLTSLDSIKSEFLGHYTDPKGQISFVQHVTIHNTKQWIKQLNPAINASILQAYEDPNFKKNQQQYPQMITAIHNAAKKNHNWISLDGHSISLTIPIHKSEWAVVKAHALAHLFHFVSDKMKDVDADKKVTEIDKAAKSILSLVQALSALPFSYTEHQDTVVFRWGEPKTPFNLRIHTEHTYRPTLEKFIPDMIKDELYAKLLPALLADGQLTLEQAILLYHGPPELKPQILMHAISKADGEKKKQLLQRLNDFALQWNKNNTYPVAPTNENQPANAGAYLKRWDAWMAQMDRYPLVTLDQSK